MDLIREYWWLIVIVVALVLTLILLRPKQRVTLTDSAPVRPHMAHQKRPPEGPGLPGEHAAATSDLAGEILRAPVHRQLDGAKEAQDDLCRLKGVGPKFADALRAAGFTRYEQLAGLTPTEVDRLDSRLGSFAGRISRDRVVEQADYLARGDTDGFEQRFGKLSS
jgi:predicted flap endonuclease-1-like 5' DNA nuclease